MRVNVKTNSFLHPSDPRVATEADLEKFGDDCHDDWNICQCDDEFFMRPPRECAANAMLIAAAPDLLAACEDALAFYHRDKSGLYDPDHEKRLIAAIGKAKGQ